MTNCNNEQNSNSGCSSEANTTKELDFATRAIHQSQGADPTTGSLITPIFQTSTFVLDELGKNKGYQYARTHNPTRTALEECLASLENAKYGVACASGLAAVSVVAGILQAGDHVIVGEDVYGGVYRLFERVFSRYGIKFTYVDTRQIDKVEAAITPQTRLVWLETPTNPLLRLADLKAIGDLAKAHNLIYVVDNTFATPYFQRPLEFGASVIVHSTTKYLSGHSDIIGGAVITSDEELYEQIKFTQNATGAVPGPMDCYLALRGIKTLALRMREHERNANVVSSFLESHPQVQEVYYPGLTSHPQHDLAKAQMSGFGGMVSFVVKGGLPAAKELVNNTKLFQLAESLGGVKSLLCHPSTMTHAPIPLDVQERCGIGQGLIRLSVGIESANDLIADLEQGLGKAAKAVQSNTTTSISNVDTQKNTSYCWRSLKTQTEKITMSKIAVLKFGGTSVKNVQRLRHVASIVKEAARLQKVIVVVSAMGDATDRLVQLANQCAESPSAPELDVLLSTGEQVTIALLTILLKEAGITARSLTGAQAGILTDDNHSDANILNIDGKVIEQAFNEFDVLVVAGFQGATASGKIATLGRGGSDTTAVAIAAAVQAQSCEIYTDVDGIYDRDPNKDFNAVKFIEINFEDCLQLAENGAQVIHPRAVKAARDYDLPVRVRSTFQLEDKGTLITASASVPEHSRPKTDCDFKSIRKRNRQTSKTFEPCSSLISRKKDIYNLPPL